MWSSAHVPEGCPSTPLLHLVCKSSTCASCACVLACGCACIAPRQFPSVRTQRLHRPASNRLDHSKARDLFRLRRAFGLINRMCTYCHRVPRASPPIEHRAAAASPRRAAAPPPVVLFAAASTRVSPLRVVVPRYAVPAAAPTPRCVDRYDCVCVCGGGGGPSACLRILLQSHRLRRYRCDCGGVLIILIH